MIHNHNKDPEGGTRKVADYWEPAQKQLLGDSRFLQHLFDYDKDSIDPGVVTKVHTQTLHSVPSLSRMRHLPYGHALLLSLCVSCFHSCIIPC
jgi:hypothetical protein